MLGDVVTFTVVALFYNDDNNNGMPDPEGGVDGSDENEVGLAFW